MTQRPPRSGRPSDRAFEDATEFDCVPGHFCVSHWRNISIIVWARRADAESLARVGKLTPVLQTAYPGGHSNIAFVLPGVQPPDEAARRRLTEVMQGINGLCCVGTVVEGEGFSASTVRSSMTGVRLRATGVSMGLHKSAEELAGWFPKQHSKRTGMEVDAARLLRVIKDVRARSLVSLGIAANA